jgi:hypothetical protein
LKMSAGNSEATSVDYPRLQHPLITLTISTRKNQWNPLADTGRC